jgi:hypothetical protein
VEWGKRAEMQRVAQGSRSGKRFPRRSSPPGFETGATKAAALRGEESRRQRGEVG